MQKKWTIPPVIQFEMLFKTVFGYFFAKFSYNLHFPRFPHFPREIQIQSRIPAGNEK